MELNRKGIKSLNAQLVEIALKATNGNKLKALQTIKFEPSDFNDVVVVNKELMRRFLESVDQKVFPSEMNADYCKTRIDIVNQLKEPSYEENFYSDIKELAQACREANAAVWLSHEEAFNVVDDLCAYSQKIKRPIRRADTLKLASVIMQRLSEYQNDQG